MERRGASVRARLIDRLGHGMIVLGGVSMVIVLLGIFFFIARETWPLFAAARVEEQGRLSLAAGALGIGVDPYREIACVLRPEGVDFVSLHSGDRLRQVRPEVLEGHRIVSAYRAPGGEWLGLGLDEGRVLPARVEFELKYPEGRRRIEPSLRVEPPLVLDEKGAAIAQVVLRHDERRLVAAGIAADGRLLVAVREEGRGLLGGGKVEAAARELSLAGRPTAVLVDGAGRRLLAGSDAGRIYEWELGKVGEAPRFAGAFAGAAPGTAITALGFVLGEVSVAVGDEAGHVSTWFKVKGKDGKEAYRCIHLLRAHAAPVRRFAISGRDKQLLSGDARGGVILHHPTSEQSFFEVQSGSAVADLVLAPRVDGFLVLGEEGRLSRYRLENPHPEINWGALWGKVWYEGYERPEYVWQSSGSDEFEPKLSLVPLAFGTAKGTFYALLFALPLALLAALYTAEFAAPQVRNLVKPTVELMASLPSVILGFLAALWLAPLLERRILGTLLLFALVPLGVAAAARAWRWLPRRLRRLSGKAEMALLLLFTTAAAFLALALGAPLEDLLFAGDFRQWLYHSAELSYDQRNSLVVGFAMGFAVIPLIFTICEDALSSVPASLRAGSLALGASRWQTAVRVVLPLALPGIFSAAMMGFGRAVGETMIVLMATGNTPITEWNIFTGMRTIAANIAVELPEAPQGGTLYRVLFLSGLLLFIATFAINTLAELVRRRLRGRYGRL